MYYPKYIICAYQYINLKYLYSNDKQQENWRNLSMSEATPKTTEARIIQYAIIKALV